MTGPNRPGSNKVSFNKQIPIDRGHHLEGPQTRQAPKNETGHNRTGSNETGLQNKACPHEARHNEAGSTRYGPIRKAPAQ
jgi:hypothetical protein